MLLLLTQTVWAHGGADLDSGEAWNAWQLTPDIVIPTLLVLAVYGTGLWRRRSSAHDGRRIQAPAFIAGVGLVFLALQSPIDPIAERLFSMHQLQHMLLRIVGPMLIAWSQPGAILVAGLPRVAKTRLLAPLLSNSAFQGTFRFLGNSIVVTVLFIASLVVWEIPSLHDAALLDDRLHYLMHVTMLAAGLLFWARIFDARPAPKGIRYGVRLMMLWIVILAGIVLGTVTTLKPMVLYHAYDLHGRLFGVPALADEQLGGVLIWIPSSMMCLIAILLVVHAFGQYETRMEKARAGVMPSNPEASLTGADLIARSRAKNRQMAIGFAGFAVSILITAIMVGVLSLAFGHGSAAGPPATAASRPGTGRQARTAKSGDSRAAPSPVRFAPTPR